MTRQTTVKLVCDRCGTETNTDERNLIPRLWGRLAAISNGVSLGAGDIVESGSRNDQPPCRPVDICDECVTSFRSWWFERRKP
jgi:hypothetical protein